jgi:hypothetical protein
LTLGEEFFAESFFFAENFLFDSRQRSLRREPKGRLSPKNFTLGEASVSGSVWSPALLPKFPFVRITFICPSHIKTLIFRRIFVLQSFLLWFYVYALQRCAYIILPEKLLFASVMGVDQLGLGP